MAQAPVISNAESAAKFIAFENHPVRFIVPLTSSLISFDGSGNRLDQPVFLNRLYHYGANTPFSCLLQQVRVVVAGDQNNGGIHVETTDTPDKIKSIHRFHTNIDNRQGNRLFLNMLLFYEIERLIASRCFDNIHVNISEITDNLHPDEIVVFYNQYFAFVRHMLRTEPFEKTSGNHNDKR
jgi:hypothetical protein